MFTILMHLVILPENAPSGGRLSKILGAIHTDGGNTSVNGVEMQSTASISHRFALDTREYG
jgi:hypothetical protein